MLKRLILGAVLALTAIGGAVAQSPPRPNVIVILADDLGLPDLSTYGGPRSVPTPNIDRLAARGVRFTRAYAAAPVCSPSRAALLSGRYPQRHGFEFLIPEGPDAGNEGLAPDQRLFSERLAADGYRTAAIGKWHLGSTPDRLPTARGFDRFFGFLAGETAYIDADVPGVISRAIPYLGERSFRRVRDWVQVGRLQPGDETLEILDNDDRYLTDVLTDEAVSFIGESQSTDPYFLYLAYSAPHSPFQTTEAYEARFAHIDDPLQRTYAAMISALDDGVGRVLDAVERSGQAENTLIVVTSDNGAATYLGISDCETLSGGKLSNFEGGSRVPFIASWPAHWPQGISEHRNISQMDIAATALAAAGLEPTLPLDGVDLTSALQPGAENEAVHETLFWRTGQESAVLAGDWKLIQNSRPGAVPWLFNLADDPTESRLQTFARRDVVADLRGRYAAWETQMQAPAWPSKGTVQVFQCGRNSFQDQ